MISTALYDQLKKCQTSQDGIMINYQELNKVVAPIHGHVPCIAIILDSLSMILGVFHAVLDLANAFFSMPLDTESEDQLAFTWEGK